MDNLLAISLNNPGLTWKEFLSEMSKPEVSMIN